MMWTIFIRFDRNCAIAHRGARRERGEIAFIQILGALGVLAVKNLITAKTPRNYEAEPFSGRERGQNAPSVDERTAWVAQTSF